MTELAPFTISRVFDAPRALLFAMNTEPAHLAKWLSPEGFHSIHVTMNFTVGGIYHYGLEGPGGLQMWGKQVFQEIVKDEKLVVIQSFSDKEGGLTRHPFAATWPLEMLATTTFEDVGNSQTKVTVSWLPHNSDEIGLATFDAARSGMVQGFTGTFAKLEAYLAEVQG